MSQRAVARSRGIARSGRPDDRLREIRGPTSPPDPACRCAHAGYWAGSPSDHLDGDRADKVLLTDLQAAMAQYHVSGGDVEIEVRQHKVDEIIGSIHLPLFGTERERDLPRGRGIDLFCVERFQICHCLGQARLELLKICFGVWVARRLDPGEARRTTSRL